MFAGRPSHGFHAWCAVQAGRQHGLLNLARDLEIVLQRQPVGDLEQHEQVQQAERKQQRADAAWNRDAGKQHDHVADRPCLGQAEPHEIDEADDGEQERRAVDHAPCGRELHREREEEQPRVGDRALVPREVRRLAEVDVSCEEMIGVARVAREQALQVFGFQIPRVSLDKVIEPAGSGQETLRAPEEMIPSSWPTFANTSSANCSSSRVWVAVTIVRTRALSRATVGNARPCAKTPS